MSPVGRELVAGCSKKKKNKAVKFWETNNKCVLLEQTLLDHVSQTSSVHIKSLHLQVTMKILKLQGD